MHHHQLAPFFAPVKPIIALFVLSALFSVNHVLFAQDMAEQRFLNRVVYLTPLEVVHNIDDLLLPTRLEAMQLGKFQDYNAMLNIAKSFVHAERYAEANQAYAEAVVSVWGKKDQSQVIQQLERELKKADGSLETAVRPIGLDENFQPITTPRNTEETFASQYTSYTAGKKIDQMLAFLVASVYRKQEDQLMLIGKLDYCRHLIEMETYDDARKAYHEAIIQYLDPKWTGALLEDIDVVIERTTPFKTASEVNPTLQLTLDQTMNEVKSLLLPITSFYTGNIPLTQGIDRFFVHLNNLDTTAAFELLHRTLTPFAPQDWIKSRSARIRAILINQQRIPTVAQKQLSAVSEKPKKIAYQRADAEGRVIEELSLLENNKMMTYKKVSHNWGGNYFFTNEEPSKDTEWLRVWKLYQQQEGATNPNLLTPPSMQQF